MRVDRLERLPVPHAYPDLNLSHYIETGVHGWGAWQQFHGDGVCSFLAWLWAAVTMRSAPASEVVELHHRSMVAQRLCHRYQDLGWCFCDERRAG